jgi:hypothetical protein
MDRVFVVILEDRHIDVSVEAFAREVDAIERAREIVAEYDYKPDEVVDLIDGWLFHALLSCEGDSVRVEELGVQ